MKNRRIKANDINGVTSLKQLQQNIARIGTLQTKIEAHTAFVNGQIEGLKLRLAEQILPFNDEVKVLVKASQIYFTANQKEFVPAGKKSVTFDAGEIGTRTTPLSVTIKKAQEVELIEELLKRKLDQCVNISKSVDKNKLKACREQVKDIPGISFNQKEEFFIAPNHVPVDHINKAEFQED